MPDAALRTERLVLRPLTPTVARELLDRAPAKGFPSQDDYGVLVRMAATPAGDARHTYVLEHNGDPVGTLGIAGALSPDGDQELGYGLVPAARGQGLGTEAVGALCAVLERTEGVLRLTAEVRPGNEPSRALLRRLGFVEVAGASAGHLLLARAAPGQPPVRPPIAGKHVC